MVQSLLIQYPNNNVPVIIVPDVSTEKEIENLVLKAKADGGLIAHTMVNPDLQNQVTKLVKVHQVKAIDFMGQLAQHLEYGGRKLKSPYKGNNVI